MIEVIFFKDSPKIISVRLKPAWPIELRSETSPVKMALAEVFNRIGGLLERFAKEAAIGVPPLLAVWHVESAGARFRRNRPILRFEIHKLFEFWGKDNQTLFDRHFQFGGRAGVAGKPWEQHRLRNGPAADWTRFHGDQHTEYEVFHFASRLVGREPACRSASFGGPQIIGFNHGVIGYASAVALFEAFARSERWQVCGFFDFCRAKGLLEAIKQQQWLAFATTYNGAGNAASYQARLIEALGEAEIILAGHTTAAPSPAA